MSGQKVVLLKPLTYMNRSGQSVRAVIDWFKFPPESVLVIYDDMALPVGRLRLRLSGSAGGHNGMKSIISHLGTQTFPRARIGIGVSRSDGVVSHVLGKFSPMENQLMQRLLREVEAAVHLSVTRGVEQAMNRYNGLSLSDLEDR